MNTPRDLAIVDRGAIKALQEAAKRTCGIRALAWKYGCSARHLYRYLRGELPLTQGRYARLVRLLESIQAERMADLERLRVNAGAILRAEAERGPHTR